MEDSKQEKKRIVNEEIEAEEWREYFMELLGEIEYKVLRGDGEEKK